MAFISNAERSLQEKWDEVLECICRLTDVTGVSHNACLGLTLQVLDKLPTIPIDLSYFMPIPMMLAYGPESYTYQTWCKDGGETSSLGEEVRASHLLMRKLKWLAHGGRIDDSSSDKSASPAHSARAAAPGSPRCLPSSFHSQSRSPSLWCQCSASHSSSVASICSNVTQKGSVQASGSESSSEVNTESQAGGNSGGKESEGEGSGGEDEPEDRDSQQGDSSFDIVEVSSSEAEESGSESGSSSSESEVEAKKAR